MGMEVVGFEMAPPPVEIGTEGDNSFLHEKENGKVNSEPGLNEPIKFGSHGDEPVKGEGNNVSEVDFPKDAVDEWPAPKQIHTFYLIKYRSYDDPKLKAKLDQADKEIQKKNQARYQITEGLKAKRSDRAQVISQLKSLTSEDKQFRMIMGEKRKEMEPLHQALGKLRNTNSASRERGGLCSSEEELNDLIQSLHYHMQHESIPLSEEKKLLREIKQLEQTRVQVIANAAMRAKIQESMGQKEVIQDQVKLIGVDLDGVRKEQQAIRGKIKNLEDELKAIDSDINSLQEELTIVTEKRDKAYASLQELRKQRDEGNSYFYQNRTLLNNARDLAAKKDIKALEELSNTEVEKFMSLWSSSKTFRDDYEKRILPSLDSRQLSRDGRMRNPDEKPLVVLEAPTPSETETVVAKPNLKRPKEDSKPPPAHATFSTPKIQEEANNKPTDSGITLERSDVEEKEGISEPRKGSSKDNEHDAAKLKEMKREEEIAKAKLASERKKKQAEKTATKAAIRAQKEAEKKLKEIEREKKAKKKAAASAPAIDTEEPTEADAEDAEPEKANANIEAPVPTKSKEQKENTVRSRNRLKGPESLPKAMIKRKKSTNYWVWAAPAALLVLMLLVLGYYYLL